MRPAALVLVAALACAYAALRPDPPRPRVVLTAASGAVALRDSAAGASILVARNLEPGASETGTVTIFNAGSAPARLRLVSSPAADRPGPGGGSLAAHLVLRIAGADGVLLVGTPQSLTGCHDLGALPAGAARTYSLTATLPNGGRPPSPSGGDNRYAGAATSVDETWLAGAGCAPAAPRILLRGVPRPCTRGDFHVSVSIRGPAPLARMRVRLGDWTLLQARRGRRFRLRVSDDWLAGRRTPLVVTAVDRAGARAWRRVDVIACVTR